MKKLLAFIASLVLVTSCFVGLSACKDDKKPADSTPIESTGGSSDGSAGGEITGATIYMPGSLELPQYTSQTLQVEILGATLADIVWSSSDPTIATVENGVISGIVEGTATITAKAGNATATCVVTVTKSFAYPILLLSQEDVMPRVGGYVEVTANVRFNGQITDFDEFSWSSADETIATVVDGVITGVKAGETVVIVSASYNGTLLEETVIVKVVDGPAA